MENLLQLVAHYAFPFVIVITVVVFVHEFGHYWVARKCGVKIETFSIGFGKEIFGWTDKRGTRWKVSWLPLGGYVKMFGDSDVASTPDEKVKEMTDDEKKISFFHQNVAKRMAIIVAGPLSNYVFAIIVMSMLFIFQGQPYTPAKVGELTEGSVAGEAGIKVGDQIVMADGQTVNRFEDIRRIVGLNSGTPMAVEVIRDDQHLTFQMTPKIKTMTDNFGGEHKTALIGIKSVKPEYAKRAPLEAVQQSVVETWNISTGTLKAIGQMLIGTRGTDDVGGPLRIADMAGKIAKEGPIALITFIVMISINLGLVNLFPVPLLDGGHLAFYVAEFMRGRPLSLRAQEIGANMGALMVVALMLFATWNDLVHMNVISFLRGLFS